ncbi:MAG: flavin reductase family protein [Bacteroidota bacterium]
MPQITSFDPKDLSQPDLHRYLLTAVAPRPICFASTIDRAGRVNLSPFSFFNVFSSNPPILVFSPAKSGRDLSHKDTFLNIQEVPEVTINIVNYPIVEQMSLASTRYEKGVNEFEKAGFTQVPSVMVKPPRVGESPISFECKVNQVIELGQGGGAGNLIISEVQYLHIQNEYLDQDGNLDTLKLDLVARMGGSWYCRAIEASLFEIPKPLREKGIGVDNLPHNVRNSSILTGNDLGRLGNSKYLPSDREVEAFAAEEDLAALLDSFTESEQAIKHFYLLAKEFLGKGEAGKALKLLLFLEKKKQ